MRNRVLNRTQRGARGTNRGRGPTHCRVCLEIAATDPCSEECECVLELQQRDSHYSAEAT